MKKIFSSIAVSGEVPTIGLEVRLVEGVPLVFTERGELVRGQLAVTIKGEIESVVEAELRFYPEKR